MSKAFIRTRINFDGLNPSLLQLGNQTDPDTYDQQEVEDAVLELVRDNMTVTVEPRKRREER